jgi:hypothetical protein
LCYNLLRYAYPPQFSKTRRRVIWQRGRDRVRTRDFDSAARANCNTFATITCSFIRANCHANRNANGFAVTHSHTDTYRDCDALSS